MGYTITVEAPMLFVAIAATGITTVVIMAARIVTSSATNVIAANSAVCSWTCMRAKD